MGLAGLPFSRAVFESVSGWTTTGLSVVDVTKAGPMILLWRSVTQLAGGAGLAIIMMSAIVGPTGVGISIAEGRSDQLVPQVRQSARLVLIIYTGYAVARHIGLLDSGHVAFRRRQPFLCSDFHRGIFHSSGEYRLLGFRGHRSSVPSADASRQPEFCYGLVCFAAASSGFVVRNGEVRLMAVLIPLSAAAVFLLTCRTIYPQLEKQSGSRFSKPYPQSPPRAFPTVGYGNWNDFGIFALVVLMLIGGGPAPRPAGSSSSGSICLWKQLLLGYQGLFYAAGRHFGTARMGGQSACLRG